MGWTRQNRATLRGRLFAFAVLFLSPTVVFSQDKVGFQWTEALLQGAVDAKLGAPPVFRALSILHTCIYDAWSAYDDKAVGTQLGGILRRPPRERTEANKQKAVSYAAYRALTDLAPNNTEKLYIPLMKNLGYEPNDNSTVSVRIAEGV